MNAYLTGAAIKRFRENNGQTQAQLAEALSVSSKTISKWETGRGLPVSGAGQRLPLPVLQSAWAYETNNIAMVHTFLSEIENGRHLVKPNVGRFLSIFLKYVLVSRGGIKMDLYFSQEWQTKRHICVL